jgi:hypothetical protein
MDRNRAPAYSPKKSTQLPFSAHFNYRAGRAHVVHHLLPNPFVLSTFASSGSAMPNTPPIYVRDHPAEPVGMPYRALALAIAAGCLAVLAVAATLTPSPAGVGTHRGAGMAACGFLNRTGIPCASCGMTTSFAWFVRGNLPASLYVQPMGTILAFGTAIAFWTGRPILRLFRPLPAARIVIGLVAFGIAAWGWKIFIHLRGIDGW